MSHLENNPVRASLLAGVLVLLVMVSAAILTADTDINKTDLDVKVVTFYPRGVVSEPTNITVKFSNDLVPDDSLNELTANHPLIIEPPISGLAKWIDNDKLRYFPDEPFLPSTEYQVKIDTKQSYTNGNRVSEKKEFEFRTPVFVIERINFDLINVPENNNSNALTFTISANYPMDGKELIKHFSAKFRRNDPDLSFGIYRGDKTKEVVISSTAFKANESHGDIDVTVKKGLNCINGNIPLQADYVKNIYIQKARPFTVNGVYPEVSGKEGRIVIDLSHPVSFKEIEEFITITPAANFAVEQRYRGIVLNGNFQPGEIYTVDISKGLISEDGQILEKEFSTQIQMPDLQPSIKFSDTGYYLPKNGNRLLEIETVNMDEISVEVEQVFVNNIVYYLTGGNGDNYYYGSRNNNNLSRKIFSKDYILGSQLNEPLQSTFDLGEIAGDSLRGIYVVSIRKKNERWNYMQRNVMITDIGIIAKMSDDYLMVWANSLSGAEPIKRARVNLISNNNQILLEGYTNSEGVAVFENIAEKLGDFEPFVITATKDGDLSYLKFTECLLPSAEFDIQGRPFLAKGYESLIYSDRGVYRPGETVHLVNVVRAVNGELPKEFPYILYIDDPQGMEYKRYKLTTKDDGLESVDIDMPSFAKTGSYKVAAKIGDEVIGQYSYQVEEFMPDRIKTTLTIEGDDYSVGDDIEIKVNGTYLFGTPCKGNRVVSQVKIGTSNFGSDKYPDYIFSDNSRKFTSITKNLPNEILDDQGNHSYYYRVPSNLTPPSALEIMASATVLEEGGRGVNDYGSVPVYPYRTYLGLHRNFKGYARVGEDITYSIIAIDKMDTTSKIDIVWAKFYKIIYHNVVKKDKNGIYRYVSEEQEQIIDSVKISIDGSPATASFTPGSYGSYRLRVSSPDTDHRSADQFYASGWGYSPWSMKNPDRLELELDKDNYKPGDKAKLLVKAPFSGRLLLTIEKDKVLEYETYDLDSNTAEVKLDIKKEYTPNIYVSATLIKATGSLERFSPARAFGIVPLTVIDTSNKLDISLTTPGEIEPNREIDIGVKTEPFSKLTVAVVDYGILQLTGFKTPDPYDFFYGKRRPSLKPYDIYSFIFPDIEPARSILSVAGGARLKVMLESQKRHVSPIISKRVKPVALWSGLVTSDDIGQASIKFDIPQYNGLLKVMAVGFKDIRCGSASEEIIVKDKILIQESLPRFVTGDDEFNARIVVFNNIGANEVVTVEMSIDGPAELISGSRVQELIRNNEKSVIDYKIRASKQPGNIKFTITASAHDQRSELVVDLPNRPPQPLAIEHGAGTIKQGKPATIEIPTNWLEGTQKYQLKLASMPALKFKRSLQYLLRYPYGCAEQTTSKLFPILYYDDIVKIVEPGLFGGKGASYYIEEGITKLTGMQNSKGGFNYWPGEYHQYYAWASIYASHFMVEAKIAGYYINEKVYKRMIKHLKKVANDSSLENNFGVYRIYAAYVLAIANELDNSTLAGLKYINLDKIPVYAKFMYAGAIAKVKGPDKALWLLPTQIHMQNDEPTETGGFFNSSLRANAILLNILLDIAPDNPSVPALIESISNELTFSRWYTTQATGWALMAVGKYLGKQEKADFTGEVKLNGDRISTFNQDGITLARPDLGDGTLEVVISGKGNCYYYWQSSGVKQSGLIDEYDERLRVRRQYFTSDGQPIDSSTLKLGDEVMVKITARALDKDLENVVINDLLPSCLEIENTRLDNVRKSDKLGRSSTVDYMDIRDDRLLLFAKIRESNDFNYFYMARVICAGEFTVPPVAAECMYDPLIRSAGSSGKMMIIE